MFLCVIKVEYLADYKLRLWFNNGISKDVDLESELYGEIFEPLKNKNLFKDVCVNQNTNTTEWKNGADFAPEFLFEIGKELKQTA